MNEFIEVPPPLWKYQGGGEVHEDNLRLKETAKRERRVILESQQVKKLTSQLRQINNDLARHKSDENLRKFDELVQSYHSKRLRLAELKVQPESDVLAIRTLAQEMRIIVSTLRTMKPELEPIRELVRKQKRLQSTLQAHRYAVLEAEKEKELQLGMAAEAELVGSQMSKTLARIGFSYTETVGKRTRTRYVKFERVIATPDQLQFKVAASQQGLAGGSINLLPHGVRVTDILTESVMRELTIALEREVWTPHINEDVSNTNGAWIVVERMGLYEGIPKNVTYKQVMARYETADHGRIPLPAGLKKGRRVNWTYLDDHASTHIMFTGITGSGKTNAIQACLAAMIEKQSPRDVLIILIDLKNQGDFKELSQAPHVLEWNGKKILHDIGDVVDVLRAVRSEMHYRQQRIAPIAKNISQYNKRVQESDRMPRIVVLFDEYANTRRGRFSEEAELIDDMETEYGQIGRASGVHSWIGIQQPRRDNMPPALRDNFTTVFVGHQANVGAAQSVSGNRSSLKLAGLPGRMQVTMGWNTFEVQMPRIDDDDLNNAVKIAKQAYGDLEPYRLHYDPESTTTDSGAPAALGNRQLILMTAFNEFAGALKVTPIHGLVKDRLSRSRVSEIVATLVSEQEIEWQGDCYEVVKRPGNFYQLVAKE